MAAWPPHRQHQPARDTAQAAADNGSSSADTASGAPPRPKGELDRRVLTTARTFDVVLRSGQTWGGVRLLEMDTWSLLVEADGRRVLLPKHAVDAYLLESV